MPVLLNPPMVYGTHQPPVGAPLRGTSLSKTLLAAYVANAGAGGVLWDSGGRWNGTLHGGVSCVAGPRGRALSFDGSTGYVSTNLDYLTIAGGGAYSIYLRIRVNDVTALQTPLSIGDMALIVVSATDWRWQHDEGAFNFITSSGPFSDNTWYDFVITSSGAGAGQTKLYIDSRQNDNGAAAGTPTGGTIQIGNQQTGISSPERWSACQVDTVLVARRAWLPQEVKRLTTEPFHIF